MLSSLVQHLVSTLSRHTCNLTLKKDTYALYPPKSLGIIQSINKNLFFDYNKAAPINFLIREAAVILQAYSVGWNKKSASVSRPPARQAK
jgi:hypothetical protein